MTGEMITTILISMLGGAIRVSTPFMFVALGETLTEKSGRINLGLEGNLILGAMVAYALSYQTGSPWIGVLGAGFAGIFLGLMHGGICSLPRGLGAESTAPRRASASIRSASVAP